MTPRLYPQVAIEIHRAGYSPVPVHPRRKEEPLKGWTGASAPMMSFPDVHALVDDPRYRGHNTAARLPEHVIGLDVDDYDDKPGAATWQRLVATIGEPPPTVVVGSRTEGLSGIRLYLVPTGRSQADLDGGLPGVDVIRHGHRYVLAPGSVHPEGRTYRAWRSDSGKAADQLPPVDDLPQLPEAWFDAFTKSKGSEAGAAPQRHRALTQGAPCQAVTAALSDAEGGLTSGRSRHDVTMAAVSRLIRLGDQGHKGVKRAVNELRQAWITTVDKHREAGITRTPDQARAEYRDFVTSATALVDATPTPDDDRGCCRGVFTAAVGNDFAAGQSLVAQRLVDLHPGKFMFVPGLGWHHYDGRRWDDGEGLAEKLVEQTVITTARVMIAEAGKINDQTHRENTFTVANRVLAFDGQLRGAVAFVARHPEVLVGVRALNAEPFQLNVGNGTIDLLTGTLRPHDPRDRLTKVAAAEYHPDRVGDRWPRFLNEALGGPELVHAVQQLVGGPGLMGTVQEHVFPVIYGPGGSGKGTFVTATAGTLGDYALEAEPDLIMRRAGAHPTGEMDLLGARVAFVSESDDGRHLAAATMKRLTGGDKIRARRMRQDFVEFTPSHLLILVTNHLPVMPSGDDPAIWRRVRVIPFDRPPAKPDKRLGDELAAERDAILTWLVAGFTSYWRHREIAWPTSVLDATRQYRDSSDLLKAFLDDETTTVDASLGEPLGSVYRRWRSWLANNAPDARPGRIQDLIRGLREHGEAVRAGDSRNKGSILAGRMLHSDDQEPSWTA